MPAACGTNTARAGNQAPPRPHPRPVDAGSPALAREGVARVSRAATEAHRRALQMQLGQITPELLEVTINAALVTNALRWLIVFGVPQPDATPGERGRRIGRPHRSLRVRCGGRVANCV